jgi:hypothetical protein
MGLGINNYGIDLVSVISQGLYVRCLGSREANGPMVKG